MIVVILEKLLKRLFDNPNLWFDILKDNVISILKEIKINGTSILTEQRYNGLVCLCTRAFPEVQHDFINEKDLDNWDYETFSIEECERLKDRFYIIINNINKDIKSKNKKTTKKECFVSTRRKDYIDLKSWLDVIHIGKTFNRYLSLTDYQDMEKWVKMNELSYQLFDRNEKNLTNQTEYLLHHLYEWYHSGLSETHWLINRKFFKYQKKENILIMDDFIHVVIHIFITKIKGKSWYSIKHPLEVIKNVLNNKEENMKEKRKYLLEHYGRENLLLLIEVADKIIGEMEWKK